MNSNGDASTPDLSHISESLRVLAVPIDSLVQDPANVRLHDDKNIKAIRDSLRAFGQRKPIVVRENGRIVEAGNGTLEAARQLRETDPRWNFIAAVVLNDDAVTAAAFAISDNRSAELARWDEKGLGSMLKAIQDDGRLDELVSGFDDSELQKLVNDVSAEADAAIANAGANVNYQQQFGVIVICSDEQHQQQVYEQLAGDGHNCKVVVT